MLISIALMLLLTVLCQYESDAFMRVFTAEEGGAQHCQRDYLTLVVAEMWNWFLNQLPSRAREPWQVAAGAGWYTFSGYARGTVIIATTDGAFAFTDIDPLIRQTWFEPPTYTCVKPEIRKAVRFEMLYPVGAAAARGALVD